MSTNSPRITELLKRNRCAPTNRTFFQEPLSNYCTSEAPFSLLSVMRMHVNPGIRHTGHSFGHARVNTKCAYKKPKVDAFEWKRSIRMQIVRLAGTPQSNLRLQDARRTKAYFASRSPSSLKLRKGSPNITFRLEMS